MNGRTFRRDFNMPGPISPGQLLCLASAGDDKAFSEFCVTVLPRLRRLVRRRCRLLHIDSELHNDITHDTVLKAIIWLKKHPNVAVNFQWLKKIAENVAVDYRRMLSSNVPLTENIATTLLNDPEPASDSSIIVNALATLSPQDQRMLRLVYYDELDMESVASRFAIGKWAAYKRLERALSRLRCAAQREMVPK